MLNSILIILQHVLFSFQFQPISSVIPHNDYGLVIPYALLAKLRRVDLRTHLHESIPSCVDILRVYSEPTSRDVSTAQELLLRTTSAYG